MSCPSAVTEIQEFSAARICKVNGLATGTDVPAGVAARENFLTVTSLPAEFLGVPGVLSADLGATEAAFDAGFEDGVDAATIGVAGNLLGGATG